MMWERMRPQFESELEIDDDGILEVKRKFHRQEVSGMEYSTDASGEIDIKINLNDGSEFHFYFSDKDSKKADILLKKIHGMMHR